MNKVKVFDESKHPRDKEGKITRKGNGQTSSSNETTNSLQKKNPLNHISYLIK